jgi:5'-3' exoribonuclease 2
VVTNLPFKWDLERVIDDFVFLCFFVGKHNSTLISDPDDRSNLPILRTLATLLTLLTSMTLLTHSPYYPLRGNDFLPELPSLEIHEGAIDNLTDWYKATLPDMGGYMTDCGAVNFRRVAMVLRKLAAVEPWILKDR